MRKETPTPQTPAKEDVEQKNGKAIAEVLEDAKAKLDFVLSKPKLAYGISWALGGVIATSVALNILDTVPAVSSLMHSVRFLIHFQRPLS